MSLADLSRILNGSRIINYEDIVFQRRKEILDSEVNLLQKITNEKLKDVIHHIIKLDHGFVRKSSFSNPGADFFYMGAISTDINRAYVNGHILELRGTSSPNDYQNKITLPAAPITINRTDFVWLEMWVSELMTNQCYPNTSKPTTTSIYKYGNINYGGTNLVDENLDVSFGHETAVRAQVQYQIRVAADASNFSSPNVIAKDGINNFSQALDIITGETLTGLYIAHNSIQTYGRFEVDENNNPLNYGYHFAIPLCSVLRIVGELTIDLNNITDLRQSIGVSTLDPDVDYTINGLIIQNDTGDATIVINPTDVNDKSRIVFKRGGIVVGTVEAFALTRIGFGDKNELEFVSLETDRNEIGINTTNPLARVHIYEDEVKTPLYIENNNVEPSLQIETKIASTQAILLQNTSGSTTDLFVEIEEAGITNFKINSAGLIATRAGEITSLSNHLAVYADSSNQLRLGYGGGGDIVFYNGLNTEVFKWNDSLQQLLLGENSTSVLFGGGYGTTGTTIDSSGNIYTDGIMQSISTGIKTAYTKIGSSDGYLYLGLNSGNFSQYLKWSNANQRFEFSNPVYIAGSYPVNMEELQVHIISPKSNIAGDPIYTDGAWTFTGFSGKQISIVSGGANVGTNVFEIQNSSLVPVAYINELGDLVVNDLHVNGTETIGSVTTIDTTSIYTNDLTAYDDTTLGNAVGDYTTITGTFRVRSTTIDTKWNLIVDSVTGGIVVNNNTVVAPVSLSGIFLNVSGGIGSIYDATDNTVPKVWVGEDFSTSSPVYGGIAWDSVNNQLWLTSKVNASYSIIQALTSNLSINITSKVPEEKLDIEGNINIANYESSVSDRMIRFRNFYGSSANNDESRLRYEASTNKLYIVKLSGGVEITPNITFDMNVSRVGVGTITPSSKLHVYSISDNDGINITGKISINDSAYSKTIPINFINDGGTEIASIKAFHNNYFNAYGKLAFYTSSSQQMIIDNIGNVGIGITNPSLDFVVSNGGLQGFEVNSSSTTITGGIDIISYNRTSPGYTPMVMNASVFSMLTGSVGIGTTNPLALLNVKGASFTGPGANKGIVFIHDELNSGLSFGCYNASPYGSWIQGLDANSSGVYPLILQPIGGYVGIGTTVPGYKLDVNTPIVPATDTYSGFQLQTDNYGYLLLGGIKQASGGTLTFSTNNGGVVTERIRFNSSGYVGIGTTDPQYLLEVYGDGRVTSGFNVGSGTTGAGSGNIRTADLNIGTDTISRYTTAADGGAVAFNYIGYNGGILWYRNVDIYNGKNGLISRFTGSDNSGSGSLYIMGGLNIGSATGAAVGCIRTERLEYFYDQINQYLDDTDTGAIALNYTGYNKGITRYRDINIYNGKQFGIASFDGSDNSGSGSLNIVGGINVGSVTGAGIGQIKFSDNIYLNSAKGVFANTIDGSDSAYLTFCGGGSSGGISRGATVYLQGNEFATDILKGVIQLVAGAGNGSTYVGYTEIFNGQGTSIARFGSGVSATDISTYLYGGLNVGIATGAGTGQIFSSNDLRSVSGALVYGTLGDANSRIGLMALSGNLSSAIIFGAGGPSVYDTILYRNAANSLKTDDSVTVGLGLNVGDDLGAGLGQIFTRVTSAASVIAIEAINLYSGGVCTNTFSLKNYYGGLKINSIGDPSGYVYTSATFQITNAGGSYETQLTLDKDGVNVARGMNIGSATGASVGEIKTSGNINILNTTSRLYLTSTIGTNYTTITLTNTGGPFYVGLNGSVGGDLATGSSVYAGVINHAGAYPLQFGTSNTVRMTIAADGKVGIGISNPGSQLDVLGSTNYETLRLRGTTTSIPGIKFFNDSGMLGQMYATNTADLVFTTAISGTVESMRMLASGNVNIPSGGLNIGSITGAGVGDLYLKPITGPIGPTIRLSNVNTNVSPDEKIGEIQFYNVDADAGPGCVSSFIKGIAAETYGRLGRLTFGISKTLATSAVEVMRIDYQGFVGIGNTVPDQLLTLGGGGTNSPYITFKRGDDATRSYIGWNNTLTNLEIYTADPANHVVLQQTGGNVGIGTTDPAFPLHVYSTSTSAVIVDAPAAQEVGYRWYKAGSSKWQALVAASSNDLTIWDTAARVTFQSGGNVGIGITNPASKLHVDSSVSSNCLLRVYNAHGSGDGLYVSVASANVAQKVLSCGSSGAGEAFVVYADGTISGIGGLTITNGITSTSGNINANAGSLGAFGSSSYLQVGINTFSAWTINAVKIGSFVGLSGDAASETYLTNYTYKNAGNWIYTGAIAPTRYRQSAGSHYFEYGATPVQGNTVAWTQSASITAAGDMTTAASITATQLNLTGSMFAISVIGSLTIDQQIDTYITVNAGAVSLFAGGDDNTRYVGDFNGFIIMSGFITYNYGCSTYTYPANSDSYMDDATRSTVFVQCSIYNSSNVYITTLTQQSSLSCDYNTCVTLNVPISKLYKYNFRVGSHLSYKNTSWSFTMSKYKIGT